MSLVWLILDNDKTLKTTNEAGNSEHAAHIVQNYEYTFACDF